MRLDQWLWAVRVFKTRTWAADAIKAGHVTVSGQSCKPAREVREGDRIVSRVGDLTRTLRVIGSPSGGPSATALVRIPPIRHNAATPATGLATAAIDMVNSPL